MTTIDRAAKRRARRIAADEAHAWARNLRLGNANAKLVLSMLTLYVDGDGGCFVSIPTLADDTELSAQTVRNRLAWLEQVGAIARLPQWIDEFGRRNGDGRGKRTSDLIRLQIDIESEAIEAAAEGVSREVSPMPQTGLNPGAETVSPAPALRQPYDSVEGLISEPEPESPLKSPQGDEKEAEALSEDPELFAAAWSAWPGHEMMRRDLAVEEFRKLTPAQQRHCRAAIPLFVKMQVAHRRTTATNFHIWIRHRGFEEFPTAATGEGVAAAATNLAVGSAEGRAVKALYGFARVPLMEHGGFLIYPLPVTPQVLAFGNAGDSASWCWVEGNQVAAWSAFLTSAIHKPRPDLVTTREVDGEQRRGMLAPWPWPPRKDGTISQATTKDEDAA